LKKFYGLYVALWPTILSVYEIFNNYLIFHLKGLAKACLILLNSLYYGT